MFSADPQYARDIRWIHYDFRCHLLEKPRRVPLAYDSQKVGGVDGCVTMRCVG